MLAEYYRKRAPEYEAFYAEPERQADLATLREWLIAGARGRRILEVAAGTGYWTVVAATVAAEITATDLSTEMLAVAARRAVGPQVTWLQADAWALLGLPRMFDLGMAHLWWSHLPRQRRGEFLRCFAARLAPGARLLMIDETWAPTLGMPIGRRDADGNTWQWRRLEHGERFEIMKNYPDAAELERDVADVCGGIEILQLRHFWALSARLR